MFFFFFFKQKTAYEMRISDWSSDVCSSDLRLRVLAHPRPQATVPRRQEAGADRAQPRPLPALCAGARAGRRHGRGLCPTERHCRACARSCTRRDLRCHHAQANTFRSEEHTSELQSLMRTSYALFCLTKKK